MKYLILLVISLYAWINNDAQVIDGISTDTDGNIYYSEVVKVDSIDKTELYLRSKQFFAEYYRSSNEVIKMDDKDAGIVLGKGHFKISLSYSLFKFDYNFRYSLRIQCKDGRYKYEIYDIIISTANIIQGPNDIEMTATRNFQQSTFEKVSKSGKKYTLLMRDKMNENILNLVYNLKQIMNKSLSQIKKEEW